MARLNTTFPADYNLPAVTNERQVFPPRHVLQSLSCVDVALLVVHNAGSEPLVSQRLAHLHHFCQLYSFGNVGGEGWRVRSCEDFIAIVIWRFASNRQAPLSNAGACVFQARYFSK